MGIPAPPPEAVSLLPPYASAQPKTYLRFVRASDPMAQLALHIKYFARSELKRTLLGARARRAAGQRAGLRRGEPRGQEAGWAAGQKRNRGKEKSGGKKGGSG